MGYKQSDMMTEQLTLSLFKICPKKECNVNKNYIITLNEVSSVQDNLFFLFMYTRNLFLVHSPSCKLIKLKGVKILLYSLNALLY